MIELEKLYLDGWLSYNTANVPLNYDGITLIKGKIGSGKSAILEAIFYLLFGKTLRGKDSVNSLPNRIINKGYEISLDFKVNNIEYSVREIRGRSGKGLYFYKNGEEKLGSVDPETRKLILEAVGMTSEEFESIAFLGQRQSQVLVEGTPGDRAKALVSIFGLNRYDASIKRCSEEIKEHNEKVQTQTLKIGQIKDELENLHKMLDEAAEPNPDVIEKKKTKLKKVTEAIDATEGKLSKLHNLIERSKHTIGKAEAMQLQSEKAAVIQSELDQLRSRLKEEEWPDVYPKALKTELEELVQNRSRHHA
jgi:DNA repair exonuclease SbcCD ATPase subunit